MLTVSVLTEVRAETKRFLKRLDDLQRSEKPPSGQDYWGSARTGAVRRASMDLTRALANLRRRR